MGLFVVNGGFESGSFSDGWVRDATGSAGIPAVSTTNPRTGTYSARFVTSNSSIRWGRLTYTLDDAEIMAYLQGRTITLACYTRQYTNFSGGPGSYWNVTLTEQGGNSDATGNLAGNPSGAYTNRPLSVAVGAAATYITIVIYWYKAGGGYIYEVNVDDVSITTAGGVSGVSIYPTNALGRVSGIQRNFWAGIGGQSVYQAVLTLGGISTTYVSPLGERQPTSVVKPSPPSDKQADYWNWLRATDPALIFKLFGHFPSFTEWERFITGRSI